MMLLPCVSWLIRSVVANGTIAFDTTDNGQIDGTARSIILIF